MSEKLNSIVGKQNDFATRAMGGGVIPIGSAGNSIILTLTPLSGQRVRLTHLSTVSAVGQGAITVSIGSSDILTSATIVGDGLGGSSVGSYQPYTAGVPPYGNYRYFTGGVGEALTIRTTTASTTSQIIYYGYQYGE